MRSYAYLSSIFIHMSRYLALSYVNLSYITLYHTIYHLIFCHIYYTIPHHITPYITYIYIYHIPYNIHITRYISYTPYHIIPYITLYITNAANYVRYFNLFVISVYCRSNCQKLMSSLCLSKHEDMKNDDKWRYSYTRTYPRN
jgi:hypothetical protein